VKGFGLHKCLESIWHSVVATINKQLGAQKVRPAAAELQKARTVSKHRRNSQLHSYGQCGSLAMKRPCHLTAFQQGSGSRGSHRER